MYRFGLWLAINKFLTSHHTVHTICEQHIPVFNVFQSAANLKSLVCWKSSLTEFDFTRKFNFAWIWTNQELRNTCTRIDMLIWTGRYQVLKRVMKSEKLLQALLGTCTWFNELLTDGLSFRSNLLNFFELTVDRPFSCRVRN